MTATNEDSPRGLALAVTAYVMWGFLPLYMKALAHVPPIEVIAHRVIWSVPIAAVILLAMRRTADIRAALSNPRTLGMAAVTAALISINWGVYVWAIASGHTLDAALGYYINPLFSVGLGALLLGERPRGAQILAIALAAVAVVVLTVAAGQVPVVALGLTFSWGFYAYFKKSLPVGSAQGFFLEVMLLTPPALALIAWMGMSGKGHFATGSAQDTWLLLGAGLVTAVPLIVYATGAKLLRLSTIGILQYIAPTMIFLTAVFVFGEPFGTARMIAFPMIWAALVLYTVPLIRESRRKRPPEMVAPDPV
ncbi:chloramphenicol-sensitive protein RarD [Palleronia aestuarii]|uniref:Chloramphenicol-sensitive protein RarD n=1 Tax=Palleronia aestuarii TaxID=568105 RepID=A0A2W7N0K4_9RHOB|nr:EamA family transporter RarD [Palleronia aestuarii]PZX13600.1 chloramphenicol-sensitive protein RarD [Palleronia aestuarii]